MKEQLISFETAKLAKEKGFDISSYYGYLPNGNLTSHPDVGDYEKNCYAPTQALLQKWLREKYSINIMIVTLVGTKSMGTEFTYSSTYKTHDLVSFSKEMFPYYEEALEASLAEALKLI